MMATRLKRSLLIGVWFMFLTLPILVVRVNTIDNVVQWRWGNMALVGVAFFLLSFVWQWAQDRSESPVKRKLAALGASLGSVRTRLAQPQIKRPALVMIALLTLAYPLLLDQYQTTIMNYALVYVILGLGLNIVVGQAGLLDLGYVAFYAVGAYAYALLNYHFALSFWAVLPLAALLAAVAGVLLGIPVLRLRGDYLAIVTLGFGEIIRLVLENWGEFSFGPSGIANIDKPTLFGAQLPPDQATSYLYYLLIGMTVFTIFVVNRLQNSRLGRSWMALREDEIACQAMGIDRMKTKLAAFALGATWAGIGGAFFAAQAGFINPYSFTLWESILVLCIVVMGGRGSIVGVVIAGLALKLLPEYFRAISEYKDLTFGAILVLMMIFRPQGLVSKVQRHYKYRKDAERAEAEADYA